MSAVATVSSLHCFKKGINLVPPVPIVLDRQLCALNNHLLWYWAQLDLVRSAYWSRVALNLEGKIMYLVTI